MTAERPDIRKLAQDIREALVGYSREQLVEMLTHLFQTYVVEGPAPVTAPQPERLAELEGLSFVEVVEALQLRLDLPELSLLQVDGGRVLARVGGRMQPLDGADRSAALPAATPAAPPAPTGQPAQAAPASPAAQRPPPGVSFEEQPTPRRTQVPAGRSMTEDEARQIEGQRIEERRLDEQRRATQAPRPTRGLSVSGSAGGNRPAVTPAATGQGGAPAQGQPGQTAQPAKKPDPPDVEGDAASRFRLLEID